MAPGLGFVRDAIIDQHFAERGRIGRLLGAVAQNPRVIGIGIDEDTAILLRDDALEVLGSGAVYIVDGVGVTHSNIAEARPERALSKIGRAHVELQSLMRISYAVFCLKKKKINTPNTHSEWDEQE